MKIKFLKAFEGDSILISFQHEGVNRNILIDGGVPKTYYSPQNIGELKIIISELPENEKIDLLIITHVDNDHIGGICKWIKSDPEGAYKKIGKVWFNSGKLMAEYLGEPQNNSHIIEDAYITFDQLTGIGQGITFEEYLEKNNILVKSIVKSGQIPEEFGLKFTILSPNNSKIKIMYDKWEKEATKSHETSGEENDYANSLEYYFENFAKDIFEEDTATHNGSSIAFILTLGGENMLFLADSHPSVIVESLTKLGYSTENKLKAKFMKVSHHGSKSNTNLELLELVDTNDYIISTNGNNFNHPHKQLLARIIKNNPNCNILFNYEEKVDEIFSQKDKIDYPNFNATGILNNEIYL